MFNRRRDQSNDPMAIRFKFDVGFFSDADTSQLTVFDETGKRLLDDHVLMLIIQESLARPWQ